MPRKNGTKADAIRAAIAKLGGPDQAKNGAVVEAVGTQGFKSSAYEVSMYKTKLRRAAGSRGTGKGRRGRKPGRKPVQTTGTTPPTNSHSTVSLAEIQTVRAVVARLGAEEVKRLVELLS